MNIETHVGGYAPRIEPLNKRAMFECRIREWRKREKLARILSAMTR